MINTNAISILCLILVCIFHLTSGDDRNFGPEIPIIADAGIGPTQDVIVEGNLAYTIGASQLKILDITDPKSPVELGRVGKLGSVRQITVRDGIAYVTARQDGLFIIDAIDPRTPKVIKHYDTIEFATGIALAGDVLLVACRHYGVELVDVSDPSNPKHLSIVRTGEAQSVTARDHYAYVGVWAAAEVVTVDIKDPWKPKIISQAKLQGYGDGVSVSGDYLYASTGHHLKNEPRKTPDDPGFGAGHGLEIFDLTDPAKPTWISRSEFPKLYEIGNDTWRVYADGTTLYAADTYNGVFILDATNPESPRFLGHHQLLQGKNGRPFGFVGGLAVVDQHVLVAGGDTDLHVLDVPYARAYQADAGTPPLIGPIPLDAPRSDYRLYRPGQQVYGVDFLEDDRAIVACGEGGAHVVRLWPQLSTLSVFETEGFATDVAVNGDLVFISQSAGGLSICRITPGSNQLEQIGHYEAPPDAVRQVEAPGDGRYVMIQVGAGQFHILDVQDPTQPKVVLKDNRHGLLYGDQMMRGLVDDQYTTVFWHVSGTHWYDLKADPPAFTGDIFPARLGSPNGQVAFGSQSLVTTRGGYVLLDRKESRPVEEVGIIQYVPGSPHMGVPNIDGDLLYCARRAYGEVTVTDISDPKNPKLVERFTTPGNPCRPLIRNGCLIIPDGYHGLIVRPLTND